MFQKRFIEIAISKRWNGLSEIPTTMFPIIKKQKQLIGKIVIVPSISIASVHTFGENQPYKIKKITSNAEKRENN